MIAGEIGSQMAAEIEETVAVLARTYEAKSRIQQIALRIAAMQPSSAQILARGTSDNAGLYLKYLIETSVGLPVGMVSPSVVSQYHAPLRLQGSVLFAISQSGQSPDLIDYADAARNAGALVISITNDHSSPLAACADAHIALQAGPETAVAATKSYSAQLLTALLLVEAWVGTSHSQESVLNEAARLAAHCEQLDHACATLDLERELVVIGRGLASANAREAALKIQETCKVSVQGLSSADYLHGPISALTSGTQVVVVSPAGGLTAALRPAIDRVRQTSRHLTWVGRGGSPLAGELVVPGSRLVDERLSCIVDAALIQRLALGMARRAGLDPDQPLGLTKVTKTL